MLQVNEAIEHIEVRYTVSSDPPHRVKDSSDDLTFLIQAFIQHQASIYGKNNYDRR